MTDFAKILRAVRQRQHLTQEQAAEVFNISHKTVQRVEAGERDLHYRELERIAEFCHSSVHEVLRLDSEQEEENAPPPAYSEKEERLEKIIAAQNEQITTLLEAIKNFLWRGEKTGKRGAGGGRAKCERVRRESLSARCAWRADGLSALRGGGFVFPTGLARFSPANAAHRAFFLQKRAVARTGATKFPFFQKQQTNAEQGESEKYEGNRYEENGKHGLENFGKDNECTADCQVRLWSREVADLEVRHTFFIPLKILPFTHPAIP